jgi:hypothetical protein
LDVSDAGTPLDVGEYCRKVEEHLTRVNQGHLVRIVGAGFELVRRWAQEGIPLSVVFRGIESKAERHREGQARRPLRIEFCDADVQAVFAHWRRAIGLAVGRAADEEPAGSTVEDAADRDEPAPRRSRSLTRHLDRAIDRLGRVAGRLDLDPGFREACDGLLQQLAEVRQSAPKTRGQARDELLVRLTALDAELARAARTFAPADLLASLSSAAAAELEPYRTRLTGGAWERSVAVTVDRLLRDRLALPVLQP